MCQTVLPNKPGVWDLEVKDTPLYKLIDQANASLWKGFNQKELLMTGCLLHNEDSKNKFLDKVIKNIAP